MLGVNDWTVPSVVEVARVEQVKISPVQMNKSVVKIQALLRNHLYFQKFGIRKGQKHNLLHKFIVKGSF